MKIVWKGKFTSVDQLPVGALPPNAVKFKEPDTIESVGVSASVFLIPVILFVLFILFLRGLLWSDLSSIDYLSLVGILLVFLTLMPHEFLHAIAFPKDAEVEIWFSLKNLMAFAVSTYPITKKRFISLSLLPNVIFGVLPLILWLMIPSSYPHVLPTLFSFGALSLTLGIGDFMNVYNALRQMPKGSMQQLSGFNSYWYMPNENSIE